MSRPRALTRQQAPAEHNPAVTAGCRDPGQPHVEIGPALQGSDFGHGPQIAELCAADVFLKKEVSPRLDLGVHGAVERTDRFFVLLHILICSLFLLKIRILQFAAISESWQCLTKTFKRHAPQDPVARGETYCDKVIVK